MDKKINNYSKFFYIFVLFLLSFLSAFAFFKFFQTGQNLLYADSISRLNIARKVVDNLTPGLAQLGNVWLPLPQLAMIPFIWQDYLWHSGIAGAIMSMTSYIIGGIYIYKACRLITTSRLGALFSLSFYALNINILYLQTTAMSESIFLCSLAATIYYFLAWFKTNQKSNLLFAALSVSAMTLIRYEGLAILLPSIPMVFLYTYIRTRKYSKAEGNTVVYATLACLGFLLWTLYLTAIFGDPLYWKNYYATPQATGGAAKAFTQAKPFMSAVWQYFTSFTWMMGIIPTAYAILGTIILLIESARKRTYMFFPLLLPLFIFLFMVLTLQKNTPIVQPDLTIKNILSGSTSTMTGFNIRYGILLLPWVAVISAYVFNLGNVFVKIVLFAVFGIQIFSYFSPTYTAIYQIPARIYDKPYGKLVDWMKKNYDSGPILVSASSHEDQMFQMGFDYKTFIHEGTNKYWKESLDDPSRYAQWVVIDPGHQQDMVNRKISEKGRASLERDFTLVTTIDQARVYKKKGKPYIQIGADKKQVN